MEGGGERKNGVGVIELSRSGWSKCQWVKSVSGAKALQELLHHYNWYYSCLVIVTKNADCCRKKRR